MICTYAPRWIRGSDKAIYVGSHNYLLHSCLSPLPAHKHARKDAYGGQTFQNRTPFHTQRGQGAVQGTWESDRFRRECQKPWPWEY
ncbi:hypothetical protein BC826DRAFT_1041439 [Russula brevipes]|nr:hypothetical protein BC826DRAFT_1041439 [Russula brevipes]